MSKRWRCPLCGKGVNAPGRMRKDNAMRYCLECTAATGKLVERVCVSRETAKKKAAAKTKAALKKAKAVVAEEMQSYPWVLYPLFNAWKQNNCWDRSLKDYGLEIKRGTGNATCVVEGRRFRLKATDHEVATIMALTWAMACETSGTTSERYASIRRFALSPAWGTGEDVFDKAPGSRAYHKMFNLLLAAKQPFWPVSARRKMPTPKLPKKQRRKKKSKVAKAVAARKKKSIW